ncbi:MAG: hypothetical protein WBD55_11890 [Dehalococcoidia bacterium]
MSQSSEHRTIDLPPMRNLGELPPDPYTRPPVRQWLRSMVGVLLVITLFLLLLALSFANVTAEGPAKRSLRASVAVLTEVDAYLDEHWASFQQEAASSPPQAELAPPDFPIEVTFTAQEVVEQNQGQFRALLLTRAAERLYDDGASAFDGEGSDPSPISLEGMARNGLDFLRSQPHDVLMLAMFVAAAASGVLALALVVLSRGYGRLYALGITITISAMPFLLFAIAARFALRLAGDSLDDPAADGFLTLAQDLTWASIRNGIVFSSGGGALLVLGFVLTRWPQLARSDEI